MKKISILYAEKDTNLLQFFRRIEDFPWLSAYELSQKQAQQSYILKMDKKMIRKVRERRKINLQENGGFMSEKSSIHENVFGFLPGYSEDAAESAMQAGSDKKKMPIEGGSVHLKKLTAAAINMFGEIEPYRRI